MRLLGHAKSIAIAVNDGLTWRAYALRQARGEWDCVGRTEEAARGGRQLPKGIIEFLAQSRARRLRVLQSGDVHTLSTVLPEDASEEELHTALAYEAQGEIGLEAAGHRLVAARADLYKMGGERKSLLAAGLRSNGWNVWRRTRKEKASPSKAPVLSNWRFLPRTRGARRTGGCC